jgi:hypothetical protein
MKLLIIGDSFAADWSVKYPKVFGWPNLLSNDHEVTNLAQAGVSEYKILQQLLSADLNQYDIVVVVHTSPYRVTTRQHPVHYADALHSKADLLLTDIEYHARWYKRVTNRALRSAYEWFLYHFDAEYQETVYNLMVDRISFLLKDKKVITVITPLCPFEAQNSVRIKRIEDTGPNHMSVNANIDFYKELTAKINEINLA